MDVTIIPPDSELPVERAFSLSMTVRTFKGRRDVDIHLFRHTWNPAEEQDYDWDALIGPPIATDSSVSPAEVAGSRLVLLESFTREERDLIVDFLTRQYQDRLTAILSRPLTFPIPAGLTGLSQVRAGENIGLVDFSRIRSYTLPIPLRGLYDLNQHKPIIATTETNP
ncbi:MAG: hypothetical protein R6W92_12690 [Desulfocurvibacter africanus]